MGWSGVIKAHRQAEEFIVILTWKLNWAAAKSHFQSPLAAHASSKVPEIENPTLH